MADSIFTRIINKQIPAKIAFEDDRYIAVHDVNPQAPVHILVIPKKTIATLNDISAEDSELIGGLFVVAKDVMHAAGYSSFRTVFNCGEQAGQTVFHLHLHVMAGRSFNWPPG